MRRKDSDINYLDIFNNLPDMATLINPRNYTIVQANRAFLKKERLSKKDAIGKKCYQLMHKRFSPCTGPLDVCPLKQTLKTRKTAYAEHIHYDSKNNPYYIEVITCPLKELSPKSKTDLVLHICRVGPLVKKLDTLVRQKSKKYLSQLKDLIIKDPLTGAYNYRYLKERLPIEIYRSKRYGYPFSLAILDIDYFKSINDVYGHQKGDRLLGQFSHYLKNLLRQSDILARYGGEEFIILMTHTDRLQAQQAASRLLNKLSAHVFNIDGVRIKLKVSVGIASFSSELSGDGQAGLLDAADKALQRAKETGGNAVVIASDLYKNKNTAQQRLTTYEEVRLLKRKIQKLTQSVDRVVLESIYAFSKSLEARDYYTAEHAEEMVSIVLKIGRKLGLGKRILNNLEIGAMLHDIGKIGISDIILQKKTRLNSEEYKIIKMHPRIGAEIIRAIHFLKDVVPIVLHHHERWDGKGYPSGLKGREIPLPARIVALADAYQALISDRPYRRAYPKRQALQILRKSAGGHFDKDLVNILIKLETKAKKAAAV
jgi:diguanylate cyclase (GGDEF)-like protein